MKARGARLGQAYSGARCRRPEEVAKSRGSSNEAFVLARLCNNRTYQKKRSWPGCWTRRIYNAFYDDRAAPARSGLRR
jgi:hypothetical protein